MAECANAELADLLSGPNNTLAIEYLKAVQKQQCSFGIFTIKRYGAKHDGIPQKGIASASWLRKALSAGEDITAYLPENVNHLERADTDRLEQIILWQLRNLTKEHLALLPDVTEGLENRLYAAAQTAQTVNEFLKKVKTRRYTHARLRRILWSAVWGF